MLYLIFSALIVFADQAVKFVISSRLAEGRVHALIPGIVHLTNIKNTGAAFSMLADMRWILVGISAVCSILLFILVLKMKRPRFCRLCLAAVLGGAVGNLIDRFLFGSVTDMFEVEFMNFAVFNVADICITAGAILFCLCYLVHSIRQAGKKHAAGDKPDLPEQDETPEPRTQDERHVRRERSERHEHREHRERRERREEPAPSFKEDTVDLGPGISGEPHFSEEQILQEFDIQRQLDQADLNDDLFKR